MQWEAPLHRFWVHWCGGLSTADLLVVLVYLAVHATWLGWLVSSAKDRFAASECFQCSRFYCTGRKCDYLQSLLTSLVFSPSSSSLRSLCARGRILPNAMDLRMDHDLLPDLKPHVLEQAALHIAADVGMYTCKVCRQKFPSEELCWKCSGRGWCGLSSPYAADLA